MTQKREKRIAQAMVDSRENILFRAIHGIEKSQGFDKMEAENFIHRQVATELNDGRVWMRRIAPAKKHHSKKNMNLVSKRARMKHSITA